LRKTYFTLSKALALFFITSVLFACRSYVPTEKVTSLPLPPLKQQLPSSPAVLTEAPPAEDIPPLEPRKPAALKKPSLLPPPPIALSEEWLVVVKKGKRKLHLYRDCRLVKTFPIDLGENPKGPKLYQGDMRTPEGLYRVIEKKDLGQTKYYLALLLDYPNEQDRARHELAVRKGKIPSEAGIGGLIEIHGEGRGEDWTQGCVALYNQHMTELFKNIPPGTPVWIDP
jgi:murein L,D-transpeptidase YafK